MSKNLVGAALGLVLGLAVDAEAVAAEPPPARTGFQMAIRTGYSLPLGDAFAGLPVDAQPMSDFVAGQVPLFFDIGGKVHPNVFVGGYLGLAFGGVAGGMARQCDEQNRSCIGTSLRLGIEGQYHILPAGPMNPWVGYGFGIESMNSGDEEMGVILTGWEYARFMGGLDFRVHRVVGVGPFLDLSMSNYSRITVRNPGEADFGGEIPDTRLHEWFTLGVRVVFFP